MVMPDLALDLGCGKNKHAGAIGLDMNAGLDGLVDVIYEVKSRQLLPFRDNTFSRIYMIDFIEHMNDIPWVLSEVHRVATKDGVVEIRFPHYSSVIAYSDVTHIHKLALHALDHFDPSTSFGKRYSYHKFFSRNFPFKITNIQPEFVDVPFPRSIIAYLTKALYQRLGADNYEKSLAHFLPLYNINVEMRVIKNSQS